MPISGNIYQSNPIRLPDPAKVLEGVTSMRQAIREEQAATQAQKDQETVRSVLQSTGGDVDLTIKRLREVGAYAPADTLEKSETARRTARANILKQQLENKTSSDSMVSGYVAAALDDPTPEKVNRLREQLSTVPSSPDDPPDTRAKLDGLLAQYDPVETPKLLQQWADGLLTEKQQDEMHRAHIEQLYGKDPVRGMAGLLAATTDPADYADEYGALLSTVHNRDDRAVIKATLPDPSTVTAENFQQVQQAIANMATTETEKTNRLNAETAAKNAAQAGSGVTLGQGQKRFERQPDGTMKEVASVAPRPLAQSGGGAGGTTAATSDAKVIADAIIKGDQPPALTGMYSLRGKIQAELARKGYDLTRATEDWTATQKYLTTLNGAQQTRLRQAVAFTRESIPLIRGLVTEWDSSGLPVLSSATLKAAKAGGMGQKAQSLSNRLSGQIADLTSELGTVYKGGNSSTDESLKLAAQNLSAEWSKKAALDALTQIDKNLEMRENSIRNTGPIGGRPDNPYAPDTKTPAAEKSVTLAELTQIAKMRKTTVEEEKARATAAGYVVR